MRSHARSVFIVLSLALAATAFAAKPISEPPATADMTVSAAAVQWSPSGSFDRLALVVSGPDDFSFTKEFAAGATPMLRLQDLGAKVADGQYTWQLRVIPHISTETREKLADARSLDDDAAVARIRAEAGLDRDNTISGSFAVLSGTFVSNKSEEPAAPGGKKVVANAIGAKPVEAQDVVTADDEIIQGSLCVGLDCVVNESFGFDTIRLKENNTRIKFQDTSTSSGFPNNVWQLTANDSNSGGLNKFSIDDITGSKTPFTTIAGAPNNSLFIASSGKVGFGNSSPGLNLHITATDTPAIRQEQTNGGGFTAQTWDIGANEANWFVRDVTGGSRLPLRIRPGAPTSSIDIAASGNVGVGTASPNSNSQLDVFNSTQLKARMSLTGQEYLAAGNTSTDGLGLILGVNRTGDRQLWLVDTSQVATQSSTNGALRMRPNNGTSGPDISALSTNATTLPLTLQGNGGNLAIGGAFTPTNPIQHNNGAFLSGGGVWTNASSRALKQDIADLSLDDAKCALSDLKPITYAYKIEPSEHHVGFIAEDVPDLVASKDRKGLSPMDIVAVLTKVVQDQQQTIDQLKARLDQIEQQKQ